jgi:hypothetical protein
MSAEHSRTEDLRVVNGGQRGALARTISTRQLIGHKEDYYSNTGYIRFELLAGFQSVKTCQNGTFYTT